MLNLSTTNHAQPVLIRCSLLQRNRKISQKQSKTSRGYNGNNNYLVTLAIITTNLFIMKNKRKNNSNSLSKEQKVSQHNPTENFKVQLSYGSLVTHNCK